MPAIKSDLHITIRLFDRSFSISGVLCGNGHWKIKRGRSWSKKQTYATTTDIFKLCLAFVSDVIGTGKRGYELRD